MTYDEASIFAQTWGLVFLVVLFLGVAVYALKPGSKEKFQRAARVPLDDD